MNFIGYGTLEGWSEVADRARPIYAVSVLESGGGGGMPEERRQVIQIAQPDTAGDVHYCRIVVGSLTYLYGKPFEGGELYDQKVKRQEAAWEIVHFWLVEQGFTVRRAAVAMPKDFKLMEGWPGFLVYASDTMSFHRRDWLEQFCGEVLADGYYNHEQHVLNALKLLGFPSPRPEQAAAMRAALHEHARTRQAQKRNGAR